MAFAKNMKLNKLIIILCIFSKMSCQKESSTVVHRDQTMKIDISELCSEINKNGGEVVAEKGAVNEVHIINSPNKCIPYINKLPSIEGFYFSYASKILSDKDFGSLRVFKDVKTLNVLYGGLTAKGYGMLDSKFPNVEELTLWGNIDSDLRQLPNLERLESFISDSDHLITIEEAKRLTLSKNLKNIEIANSESPQVFELLKSLPKIKNLNVGFRGEDGEQTFLKLP